MSLKYVDNFAYLIQRCTCWIIICGYICWTNNDCSPNQRHCLL